MRTIGEGNGQMRDVLAQSVRALRPIVMAAAVAHAAPYAYTHVIHIWPSPPFAYVAEKQLKRQVYDQPFARVVCTASKYTYSLSSLHILILI